jgi:argininosuccinate synthase
MPGKTKKKIVLAYSGGLDTTVIIKWLQENMDADVVAVCVDVGQAEDLDSHASRAISLDAECKVIDAVEEFATSYILPAIRANLVYGGAYPAGTALARPLICEKVVEVAKSVGATALAHGCTAKGNDQVRFESSFALLAPDVEVVAPMRVWGASRDEEMEYAASRGIEIPAKESGPPYSIDENLWGRSIEGGDLENPWTTPTSQAYAWTVDPEDAPSKSAVITIDFLNGNPVAIDGKQMGPVDLVKKLNNLAGSHGIGRIDVIEDRVVGIKSREIYEYPAAVVLLAAHKALEHLTLSKEVLDFKETVEHAYAQLVYGGKWFSPLRNAIQTMVDELQLAVNGKVKVKLYKGSCTITGLSSQSSLYDAGLASYGTEDSFDHGAAEGFLKLYTLPMKAGAKAGSIKNGIPSIKNKPVEIKTVGE